MGGCNCNHKICTNGMAEPFVMINNYWEDLIELNFCCPICKGNIDFFNNKSYPDLY